MKYIIEAIKQKIVFGILITTLIKGYLKCTHSYLIALGNVTKINNIFIEFNRRS